MTTRARRRLLPLALLVSLTGASCAEPPADEPDRPPPTDTAELMAADRAFAAEVAEGGAEAWVSWFEPTGAMVQSGVGEIRGREDVLAAMSVLDSGFALTWDPYRAEIAAAGDMGYTVGRWTSEQPDGVTTHGVYVSIWRRQPDGGWKVSMDLGNPVGDGPWPEG